MKSAKSSKRPLAAVVLAAGKGTRMMTDRPKVLHEVCGRPLVHYPVRRALEAGVEQVVVVVGHEASRVEEVLRAAFPDAALSFALQREQLGTAHAVLAAKGALRRFQGDLLILSGDTPLLQRATLEAVVEAKRQGSAALAFATMHLENPAGYGRVVHAPHGGPALVVEERDATPGERAIHEVNAGLYCADVAFLWETLGRVDARNAKREFYLTDLVALAADGAGAVTARVSALEASGVNDQEELSLAVRALTRRFATAHMKAGVTIEDPERFDCDEDVAIGSGTVVEPGVRLRGRTVVGQGCRIGQGCILTDTVVEAGAVLKPYCVTDQAAIGQAAQVGPFSRLRPGADLGPEVKVGNFVEVKKSRLGKGSKAQHLTYLGDATIGEGVNVGCGTVTCNYDGEKKSPTTIGDGAFIGSDSILVAPLSIGQGAYVAAGSTLTEDVPAGALALGRARQVNKPGWAAARRQAAPAAAPKARAGAPAPKRR